MIEKRFAEDANYFTTTVHPAQSMGEIQAMLDDFGADSVQTATGKDKNDVPTWMIRFHWLDQFYRITFRPLDCRNPEKEMTVAGKRRTCREQAKYQMGRIAYFAVKALLTAAEAMPGALTGFAELNAVNADGIPVTVQEVNIGKLSQVSNKLLTSGGE
jgi:hypothetical protein